MIRFDRVAKQYPDGTVAVQDVSFTAPTGKLTVLIGPSGCGKTTSLRMINRLVEPTGGTVYVGDDRTSDLKPVQLRRRIGYVIQSAGLFPHRTVLGNVMALPRLLGTPKAKASARAYELLELVGLSSEYAKRYPWQLSGGQQQRVGVARALATDPPYLLMDEPFSAVDPVVRAQLQDEFIRLQHEIAKTIVMVTHDMDEALKLGDQIVILRQGGTVAQADTPVNLLRSPADYFVAGFLGEARGYHMLAFLPLDASVTGVPETPGVLGRPVPTGADRWLLVTDDQRHPVGWLDTAAHRGGPIVASDVTVGGTIVPPTGSYRDLANAVLSSPSGRGVLVDQTGAFAGTMSINDVGQALHRIDREAPVRGRTEGHTGAERIESDGGTATGDAAP